MPWLGCRVIGPSCAPNGHCGRADTSRNRGRRPEAFTKGGDIPPEGRGNTWHYDLPYRLQPSSRGTWTPRRVDRVSTIMGTAKSKRPECPLQASRLCPYLPRFSVRFRKVSNIIRAATQTTDRALKNVTDRRNPLVFCSSDRFVTRLVERLAPIDMRVRPFDRR